jgi:two-component system, NtrC family, sensor histidine kinase PilS
MFPNKLIKKLQKSYSRNKPLHFLLFLRVLILTVLLGLSVLMQFRSTNMSFPPISYVGYFIASVYLFTIISVLSLLRIKTTEAFTHIQLIIDSLLVGCLIIFTGGTQSIFTIMYYLPIISAALLRLKQGGLLLAALSTLGYGMIVFLEFFKYIPTFLHEFWSSPLTDILIAMHYFAVHGFSFFMVAVLSSILSERLRKTEDELSRTSLNYNRLTQLYKQIVDNIPTGIITIDSNGIITSFNQASELITGFKASELINKNLAQNIPELSSTKEEKKYPFFSFTNKNNSKIPISYSRTPLNSKDGTNFSQVITLQDLSAIKKMEQQVKQVEKMATIGEMAAKIAHEFRNPLAAISGAAQILKGETETRPETKQLMDIIIRESDRLEGNINDFLQFSRPSIPEKKWFSLIALIKEVFLLFLQMPDQKCNCKLIMDIPEQLDCWADPHQIRQIILNLISNSCSLSTNQAGEIIVKSFIDKKDNQTEWITIEICDNGPGISENIIKTIFEPFFTTRENGTGLGLAIVRQLTENHNGRIRVKNNQEEGCTFSIHLPLPS